MTRQARLIPAASSLRYLRLARICGREAEPMRGPMLSFSRAVLQRAGVILILACAGIGGAMTMTNAASEVATPSGLRFTDIKVGKGAEPQAGQTVTVNYTGWLYVNGKKGKKFDSSLDRGQPFSFVLGHMRVIKGWDEGVSTMRIGGKRMLIIPPELGYGEEGAGNDIPPNATLLFEVDLISAK
jgi:FKBP-type peptidyl-prolyl cis-trans isomerase FkpA